MTRQVLFEDDFNGSVLGPEWGIRGAAYTEGMEHAKGGWAAVELSGSHLRLKTIKDISQPQGLFGPYLNGHLGTMDQIEVQPPCWVAVQARVHPYHGSHCSVWLQSVTGYAPGDAEVDIMECFGSHDPDRKSGTNLWHNVYWREAGQGIGEYRRAFEVTNDRAFLRDGTSWYQRPLVFKVHWTKDFYRFYVSNRPVAQITEGLSISPKYLVLSMITRDYEVANQGVHTSGDGVRVHPISQSVMPVDWIRVWRNR